ncbi:hypothetical protein MTR67_018920 [Solanum verrucosum]|uniref:Mediator complex subunit 15 KIX domain-containing protein n=1 Tax=Solanum verrucosum TaxID=315347 RepID=A0AAF0QN75_SOLVR|nr:hypothetical protein MTR67_018920 [Solanum verrucosum]
MGYLTQNEGIEEAYSILWQDVESELMKIAVKFEEKVYNAATSQAYIQSKLEDYLRKIAIKMLTMEIKSKDDVVEEVVVKKEQNSDVVGHRECQSWGK